MLVAIYVCVGLTAVCLTPQHARAQLCPQLQEIASELDALDAEIALIRDLNRLQLTKQQVEQLIPAVEALRATAIGVEQERAVALARLRPLLKQKREVLLRDEQPEEAVQDQIARVENRLAELDARYDEKTMQHAEAFRGILTEPQIAIITGEEQARRQVVELLEWVRGLDDEDFEREVPPYAEELADPDVGLGEDELLDLLTLARAMDDEQYERGGEEIRGRLTELFRPDHETADRIITSVFLYAVMPKVLEDKLELMGE
jgi:hypothetical protein